MARRSYFLCAYTCLIETRYDDYRGPQGLPV